MSNRYAIATVVVVERRKCQCGMSYDCPSPRLFELQTTHEGVEYKKWLVPIQNTTTHIPSKHAVHILHREIDSCHHCFNITAEWKDLKDYRPTIPETRGLKMIEGPIPGLRIAKEPRLEDLV